MPGAACSISGKFDEVARQAYGVKLQSVRDCSVAEGFRAATGRVRQQHRSGRQVEVSSLNIKDFELVGEPPEERIVVGGIGEEDSVDAGFVD